MRFILTTALAILFAVGFVAFFLVNAVLSYTTDADALVETAREARARDAVIDVIEELLYQELIKDPDLAQIPRTELRRIVGDVVSEEWFEGSLRDAHDAFTKALDESRESAVIDLRPTKQNLRKSLVDLERRAEAECAHILGPEICADAEHAMAVMAVYQARGQRAIDRIPDDIDLLEAITGGNERATRALDISTVRNRLADSRTIRWIGLGLLAAGLLAIAIINIGSLKRMLLATGATLLFAVAVYLAVVSVARGVGRDALAEELSKARAEAAAPDRVDEIAREGAQRLTIAIFDHATRRSTTQVAFVGVAGLGLLVAGIIKRP